MQDGGDSFRGLGYLDSHQDTLTLEFAVPSHKTEEGIEVSKRKRRSKQGKKSSIANVQEVVIAQDKTALRSRKGDTGSVLWRARCVASVQCTFRPCVIFAVLYHSYEFAQLLLNERNAAQSSFLDPAKFADAHVLELGYALPSCPLVRN